jgi:hypothetical protein
MQLTERSASPSLRGGAFNRAAGVGTNDFYGVAPFVLMGCGEGSGLRQSQQLGGRPEGALLRTSRRHGLRFQAEGSVPAASLDK